MKLGVTLVPSAAIQRGAQQSTFCYVVLEKPSSEKSPAEKIIAIRKVAVGTSEGELG